MEQVEESDAKADNSDAITPVKVSESSPTMLEKAMQKKETDKQPALDNQKRKTKLINDQKLMKQYFESDAAKVRERITKSKDLQERLGIMARSSLEMKNILNHHVKCINQDHVAQCDEAKKMNLCTLEPLSSLNGGTSALHRYLSDAGRYKTFFTENFKETLLKVTNLATQLKVHRAKLKSRANQFNKEMLVRRKACETTWTAYYQEMSKSGGDNIAKDPYLTGRLFDRKTLDYQAIQKSYTTEMGQIFDKVITLDRQRLEEQKSILVDYMMNLKEFHRQEIARIEKTLDSIQLVNPEEDVKNFVNKGKFYTPLYSSEDRTPIFNVPLQFVRNQELVRAIHEDVERWGEIYRPGKIIASNWKPVHAIVTKYGYFHFFQDKQDETPSLSIRLKDSTVAMKSEKENCFELALPVAGWSFLSGNTSYIFKCESQENMIDWIVTLKKYCKPLEEVAQNAV